MDGHRFDDWTRFLATVRSRRTLTHLLSAGALLAPLAAGGLGDTAAKGKGKGKGKKKRRKKPVCLCSAAGCTSLTVNNRSSVISQNPTCNYAGPCTINPCAATEPPPVPPVPPPPVCSPEP